MIQFSPKQKEVIRAPFDVTLEVAADLEEWKPIKGFEHYQISNKGRVKGSKRENASKRRKRVRVINEKLGIDQVFESAIKASKELKINYRTIRALAKKEHETIKGYRAFYV